MRMENLPPLFFGKQPWSLRRHEPHGWYRSLLALPATLVTHWLHRGLRKRLEETPSLPRDLWEGQGVLLLYSTDPHAFALRASIARVLQRFPHALLAVHASQAAWWQAFFPETAVRSVPELRNGTDKDALERELTKLQGDWCWNLREDDHPYSRALTRVLGKSWRIGKGQAPWTNLSIEPPADSLPLSGARIATLARTFGWPETPVPSLPRGTDTAFHVPALPSKKLLRWQEAAQELAGSHRARVYRSGEAGGLGALECKPLPEAPQLRVMANSLARWIGPWDVNAGALAACGVEVLVVGRAPKGCAHRQVSLPRAGQAAAWCRELLGQA